MQGKGWGVFDNAKKDRILILSKPKVKPIKQTHNRKHISHNKWIEYGDIWYEVDVRKSGLYTSMLRRMLEQFTICENKWGRVLVVRFDLRQTFYTKDNHYITRFMDNLKKRLRRQYGLDDIGYVWTREQERSKNQHYHFALFINGGLVRYGNGVAKIVTATWEKIELTNSVWIPKKAYYFVDNEKIKAKAIYRISYLAKGRGKGYRPPQTKDYSTSRLTNKTL